MSIHTNITVGFVPIARTTFDIPLAEEVTAQARRHLARTGFAFSGPDSLVTSLDAAQAAASALQNQPLDLLVVFQASFADSTMLMQLAQTVDAPLLLWAIPEAQTGGRLRLNSLCGINLGGHGLTRAGISYDYLYAAPEAQQAIDRVKTLAKAGRARRLLRQARVGRIGQHPDGFDTCQVDPPALRAQIGVEVVQLELSGVLGEIPKAEPQRVAQIRQKLGAQVSGLDAMDQPALNGTLGAYVTMRDLADNARLNGLAVRCWPEFFTEAGCAACGAMSMLSDELTPCSCEVDVNGTITQLMLQWLSDAPAFGTDLVSLDEERDGLVLWHCGLAPLAMADPDFQPRATVHSNRKLPLLMEFPLKPGRVTVARLSEATGSYRLVIGGGEVVQAPMSFGGTSGVLRFDRPARDVLDTILTEGLEHHVCLTYGDYTAELQALAAMLNLPVLDL